MEEFTQRDQTANKSFVDIEHKHIFLFDNKFNDCIFNNNTGGDYDLVPGLVVIRDTANPTKVIPAVAGATLANIVGIISLPSRVEGITTGSDVNAQYCHGGMVNAVHLVLPAGVTMDTVHTAGAKTVGDILRDLGFELKNGVSNTKFDN